VSQFLSSTEDCGAHKGQATQNQYSVTTEDIPSALEVCRWCAIL